MLGKIKGQLTYIWDPSNQGWRDEQMSHVRGNVWLWPQEDDTQIERCWVDLEGAIYDEVELWEVFTTYNNQELAIKQFQYEHALAQSNEYQLNLESGMRHVVFLEAE